MPTAELSSGEGPAARRKDGFKRLWRLTLRNLFLGSLISILPTFPCALTNGHIVRRGATSGGFEPHEVHERPAASVSDRHRAGL